MSPPQKKNIYKSNHPTAPASLSNAHVPVQLRRCDLDLVRLATWKASRASTAAEPGAQRLIMAYPIAERLRKTNETTDKSRKNEKSWKTMKNTNEKSKKNMENMEKKTRTTWDNQIFHLKQLDMNMTRMSEGYIHFGNFR